MSKSAKRQTKRVRHIATLALNQIHRLCEKDGYLLGADDICPVVQRANNDDQTTIFPPIMSVADLKVLSEYVLEVSEKA